MILEQELPENQDIAVEASSFELVVMEDSISSLALVFPPVEDIKEIESLRLANFSLKSLMAVHQSQVEGLYSEELKRLTVKYDRFSQSAVFLNRLANLAQMAGDAELEAKYLEQARALVNDEFSVQKIGENFLLRGLPAKAEEAFGKIDLSKSAHANLRMAYFAFYRNEIDTCREYVSAALEIDPLDFNSRLFEGALKFILEDYRGAIFSFRVAESERPNSSVVHANIGLCYIRLGLHKKAFSSLKRAIVFDPLNKSALCLYADLAFSLGRNDDSIPALRYFIEYEQKEDGVWSRLARALISIGGIDEAISALKRQASIADSTSVWNNLGVAYFRQGRVSRHRAYQSFKHAVTRDDDNDHDKAVAIKNLCHMLAQDNEFNDVIRLTGIVISRDKGAIISHRDLSDIYALQISAAADLRKYNFAEEAALRVLSIERAHKNVVAWAVSWLIAHYALEEDRLKDAVDLSDRYQYLVDDAQDMSEHYRIALLNNLAFVYVNSGAFEKAERFLSLLSTSIHREPYPTATLGFFHIRKGQVERGEELYAEAVRIASRRVDKDRIKQKYNFEIGRHLLLDEPKRAVKFLEKAIEKDGQPQVSASAARLISRAKSLR